MRVCVVCVFDWVLGCVHLRLGLVVAVTLPYAAAACVIVAVMRLLLRDSAQQRVRALHAPICLNIA